MRTRASPADAKPAAPPPRPPDPDDLLTVQDVMGRTRLSRPTIYRYVAADRFPAPIKLSGGTTRWVRREVDAWQEQMAASRAQPAP